MKMAITPKVEHEQDDTKTSLQSAARICIACRKTYPTESLLRFVVSPRQELVFDVKGYAPGRGAYVCANDLCFQNAVKKRAFSRSFKGSIFVNFEELFTSVKESLLGRILENLGLAYCAGQCVAGRTKVQEMSLSDKIIAFVIASDLSTRSVTELDFDKLKEEKVVVVLTGPFKNLIGQALGRSVTGVVALLKGRISDRIVCDLQRWQFLSNPGEATNEEIFNG